MKKRLLSILLCLAMVLGMLPTMVFAAEESTADAPEAPAMTTIPMTYIVNCKDGHDAAMMNLIFDTFKIGDVKKVGDEYVCPVTIYTDAYAKEYSAKNGKHFAVKESITYNMTWNGEAWEAPAMTAMPAIELACVPEAPAATAIPTEYIVNCEGHAAAQMSILPDTFEIGEVAKVDGKYVCPITINTEAYAKAYSAKNGKHEAVEESITYNMTWNGEAWEAPAMTEMPVIEVACVIPEAPVETQLPQGYMVKCTSRKFFHRANFMFQIPETVTIGEVQEVGGKYVCPITVSTKAYADAYSKETGKVHAAIKPSVTYNMTWDGEKWNAPKYSELPTIEVACARYHCWFPFGK